jgi:hypothetical protein
MESNGLEYSLDYVRRLIRAKDLLRVIEKAKPLGIIAEEMA